LAVAAAGADFAGGLAAASPGLAVLALATCAVDVEAAGAGLEAAARAEEEIPATLAISSRSHQHRSKLLVALLMAKDCEFACATFITSADKSHLHEPALLLALLTFKGDLLASGAEPKLGAIARLELLDCWAAVLAVEFLMATGTAAMGARSCKRRCHAGCHPCGMYVLIISERIGIPI